MLVQAKNFRRSLVGSDQKFAGRSAGGDSPYPALLALEQPRAGFHSFRRFRESVLQMSDARNLLIDYWMGHENQEMGTRYAKQLIENIEWRKEWAEKGGLGFELPNLPLGIGQLGQPSKAKTQSAKAAQSAANVGDIWLPGQDSNLQPFG
jgi:hypothetical protein